MKGSKITKSLKSLENIPRFNFPFPYNWSEKQFFIYACLAENVQQFYKDWIEQGRKIGRVQFFDTDSNGKFTHKYWRPSNICCESGEALTAENIDIKVGYWLPNLWKPIRKDLKQQVMKAEALECQKIDCSCNDCTFLDRGKSWCNKLDKRIDLNANFCHTQNQECFVHRKDKTVTWESHKIGDQYTMDGKTDKWKIAYYPITECGKTGEKYNEPRALVERKIDKGIDFREVPLRYLTKV